jgi:hypothetical protein
MALLLIPVNLVSPASAARVRARPRQTPTSSSTNSVDLHPSDTTVRLPPPMLAVRGMVPAWPRFGAAVAGMCHRVAMHACMNTPGNLLLFCYPIYSILSIYMSCAYWFLSCVCCCCYCTGCAWCACCLGLLMPCSFLSMPTGAMLMPV